MIDKQYTYAVARIRSKELLLLGKSDVEQIMNCKSEAECLRLLAEKGWGKDGDETAEQLLSVEREKTWELMEELVEDMSDFDTFLYINDFHNLKAAIKQVYMNASREDIFVSHGTVKPELILRAVTEHDFSLLPDFMRECAEEAYYVQLHTGDSQLCDIILDKAALETTYQRGKASGVEVLAEYVELMIVAADINIAIRSSRTGKDRSFLERALVSCDTIDIQLLIEAVLNGEDAIYEYLALTVYADAVQAIKKSASAFECWCDNLIISHIQSQKYNSFTLSPLAAYILARENEIKTMRIVLSGKRNSIPDLSIRERLREMYV